MLVNYDNGYGLFLIINNDYDCTIRKYGLDERVYHCKVTYFTINDIVFNYIRQSNFILEKAVKYFTGISVDKELRRMEKEIRQILERLVS